MYPSPLSASLSFPIRSIIINVLGRPDTHINKSNHETLFSIRPLQRGALAQPYSCRASMQVSSTVPTLIYRQWRARRERAQIIEQQKEGLNQKRQLLFAPQSVGKWSVLPLLLRIRLLAMRPLGEKTEEDDELDDLNILVKQLEENVLVSPPYRSPRRDRLRGHFKFAKNMPSEEGERVALESGEMPDIGIDRKYLVVLGALHSQTEVKPAPLVFKGPLPTKFKPSRIIFPTMRPSSMLLVASLTSAIAAPARNEGPPTNPELTFAEIDITKLRLSGNESLHLAQEVCKSDRGLKFLESAHTLAEQVEVEFFDPAIKAAGSNAEKLESAQCQSVRNKLVKDTCLVNSLVISRHNVTLQTEKLTEIRQNVDRIDRSCKSVNADSFVDEDAVDQDTITTAITTTTTTATTAITTTPTTAITTA
ncbi:hypothetical protein BDK51DRAFT_33348, partial [Blyttiomyces helicus]